jgi:protein-tyrosine phosphatase
VSTETRHVTLAGCFNFRDLGGYATEDGRELKWQRLYRADGLTRLSTEDCAALTELGLSTVIDLRTKDEVDQRGKFPVEVVEVEYHHLPLSDSIPGTEEIRDWGEPQFVSARYRQLLTEGAGSIARAIHLLASPGSLPAVFHCSAGKDRTGVLAAVVLGCLGVSDAVIIDDYSLSSIGTAKLMDSLRAEYADSVEEVEKYAAAILRVMPDSMDGFIDHVRTQYGDFDGLAKNLGVVADIDTLKTELLQPSL